MHDPAAAWSRLHHDIDPRGNRLLWCWLRIMWRGAAPLARAGLPPTAVTAAGALLAVVAALGHWPWVALVLVIASVGCDGLDGAVAVLGDSASAFGAVADKLADRIADVAFVIVIWRCGAAGWLAWITGAAVLGVEAWREITGGRARSLITVAERPSRAVCTVLACLAAAVWTTTWPPTVCCAVLLALSVIAVGQLARVTQAGHAR